MKRQSFAGLSTALRFSNPIRGFPKITGIILGVPTIRIAAFWGLYWGPPVSGNYPAGSKSTEHLDRAPLLRA